MSNERYKYYRLSPEEREGIKKTITQVLKEEGIELAIIPGSFIELKSFRNVDVAVYASSRKLDFDAVIKPAVKLE